MSASDDRVTLSYRTPARRAWPEWFSRDKLAELSIGLGWTACGISAILTVVTWLFLRMEPRQPITGPWWAFIAFCLAFNTLGLVLILIAAGMKIWNDTILVTLWIMTLLLALAIFAAHTALIATAPSPPKPVEPLRFEAPEGQ